MKKGYTVKKSIKAKEKEFPLSSKKYPSAHREANKEEKAKYPSGFKQLTKLEHHLGKEELLGHSTKSGTIQVSKKVPKKYRKEVAYHEKVENDRLCERCKKCKKSTSKCKCK